MSLLASLALRTAAILSAGLVADGPEAPGGRAAHFVLAATMLSAGLVPPWA